MSVAVAEYLGVRTDQDEVCVSPCSFDVVPMCPFATNMPCVKCKSSAKNEPVCAVRNSKGEVWITCPDRLCSTKKDVPLGAHQKDILLKVARTVYSSDVQPEDVCVKREVRLSANDTTKYNADYIMSLKDGRTSYPGPDRLIVEMQGGGETTGTGVITRHLKKWRDDQGRTNKLLREQVQASTLETNAWRRQQEQFIVKGNIAMKTWKGYGICFCVGTLLYDYLMSKVTDAYLPDLKKYNWTLAIVAFKEGAPVEGGKSLQFEVDESRMLFTNYQTFVQALINQGQPTLEAFTGDFVNLNNEPVTIWT